MDTYIEEKKEIWTAQNQVYATQVLHGNVPVEKILGLTRTQRVEKLMDKLDAAGETY